MEAPFSELAKAMCKKVREIDKEVRPKVYLIDSLWAKWPLGKMAKYSLRNLEAAIDNKESEEEINKMFKKHEELIQILKPYSDFQDSLADFIYCDLYEQKYSRLKTKFLTQ